MNVDVMNRPKTEDGCSGSEVTDSVQPLRRDTKPTNQTDDDPVRFSTIYRMFEAKSAPPKVEKGVTAHGEAARRPTPTNRLKTKKANASTMTEPTAYGEDDVNDDDILQADIACGSSTFDQQTEIDEDWLKQQGDANRSANHKKPNGVKSDANFGLERSDLEGDDVFQVGAVDQRDWLTGGKLTQRIPVDGVIRDWHEVQRTVGKNQNCPKLMTSPPIFRTLQQDKVELVSSKQASKCTSNAVSREMKSSDEDDYDDVAALRSPPSKTSGGKSGSALTNSPKLELQKEAGRGILVAGSSVGEASNYQRTVEHSKYANFEIGNDQGTTLINSELEGNENFEVIPQAVKGIPKSVSFDLPIGGKYANAMSSGQGGTVIGSHDEVIRNQGMMGGAGTKCTGTSGNSYDEVIYSNYDHTTKSANQQFQQEEDYEELYLNQPRRGSRPHTGTASDSCSSKSLYETIETYENVAPLKSQKVNSEAKVYQKESMTTRNRLAIQNAVDISTESSEEVRQNGFMTLPGIQPQQKFQPAAGRNPSEPDNSSSSTESGTRKHASSSSITDNALSLGHGSNTCSMMQSIDEDQYNSNKTVKGTVPKREDSAIGSQMVPKESIRKSMSTNTEPTEHPVAKTCAELEVQTESFDDVSQPNRDVRDQSTDPDEDSLDKYFWYFGDVDREMSEVILEDKINEPGSYLVRMSQRGGDGNPYTLSVVYMKRIYHLLIRQRSDGKFSIGKEKHEEKVFFSVPDLMTFYRNNFVELIGDPAKKTPSGKIQLKTCPRK